MNLPKSVEIALGPHRDALEHAEETGVLIISQDYWSHRVKKGTRTVWDRKAIVDHNGLVGSAMLRSWWGYYLTRTKKCGAMIVGDPTKEPRNLGEVIAWAYGKNQKTFAAMVISPFVHVTEDRRFHNGATWETRQAPALVTKKLNKLTIGHSPRHIDHKGDAVALLLKNPEVEAFLRKEHA